MPGTAPPRLLLVEDDADTASLIRESLQTHFHSPCVRHCFTLAEARAVGLRDIDLVVSDMNLPDGTGLELLTDLLTARPDLPVVLVTGEGILDNAIAAIRQGAYDYVVKAGDYLFAIPLIVEKNLAIWRTKQDNLRLQTQLSRTLEDLRVKNQQLEQAVHQLETMACTDPLTGVANRRALAQALERCFAEAQRHGRDLACLMIDLDGFKQFNDTLGHQRGDELLQRVGRVLEANCRRSDVAGRFGGDEFILLLPRTDPDTARLVAGRIAEQFAHALAGLLAEGAATAPAPPPITLSMGLTCLSHGAPATPEQLIAQADHALYRAKASGKNRLVIYRPVGAGTVAGAHA